MEPDAGAPAAPVLGRPIASDALAPAVVLRAVVLPLALASPLPVFALRTASRAVFSGHTREGLPPGVDWPRPGTLPDLRSEIESTGLFGAIDVRQFDWEIAYNADAYIALLETFSGHIAMKAVHREHLFREIRRRLAQRTGPRVRRHWGAVLHVARRLDEDRQSV
jgi:hypothetical protein